MLTDLGALGGNNLVVLVASVAWACLAVDAVLGGMNVRGLVVQRTLPDEVFARSGCRGSFRVTRTSRLAAHQVTVGDGIASTSLERVGAGETVECASWWRFRQRGPTLAPQLTIRSRFPFGLFDHQVQLGGAIEVLVYPCPRAGRATPSRRPSVEGASSNQREGSGDLRDLRPYRPGDRLRTLHWPTSARTGRPMVGIRCAEEDAGVLVALPHHPTENALEEATGALLDAWEKGVPVGLTGLDPRLGVPRRGIRWRRRLLDAIARVGVAA